MRRKSIPDYFSLTPEQKAARLEQYLSTVTRGSGYLRETPVRNDIRHYTDCDLSYSYRD